MLTLVVVADGAENGRGFGGLDVVFEGTGCFSVGGIVVEFANVVCMNG